MTSQLREKLSSGKLIKVPCCHDAFTARLAQNAGFDAVFGSGFVISAANGMPDTGLITMTEMVQTLDRMTSALPSDFIVFGDGDTGFGNAMNVRRTVQAYARAGVACIMLEDQIAPKQCGHTMGKQVLSREESVSKIKAAVDAANELRANNQGDILIMARTDARGPLGFEEAIERCNLFRKVGADITFLEAPLSIDELEQYAKRVSGPKMCNMLAGGLTPAVAPCILNEMGFSIAVYPFDILLSMIESVTVQLRNVAESWDKPAEPFAKEDIEKLWHMTGFRQYQNQAEKYDCLLFKSQGSQ